MAIKELSLGHAHRELELLALRLDSVSFNATFISNNKLEKCQSVRFLVDDEDPYFLGMKFYLEKDLEGCMTLMASSDRRSNARTCKAKGLYNAHGMLKQASQLDSKELKSFEITKDIDEDYYKIYLRPIFENRKLWDSKNSIPTGIGIYRYLDAADNVIYIGKGNIKDRANSQERANWGIVEIQYSHLKSDDECFKWESFYIDEYEKSHGAIPPFNRISGKQS